MLCLVYKQWYMCFQAQNKENREICKLSARQVRHLGMIISPLYCCHADSFLHAIYGRSCTIIAKVASSEDVSLLCVFIIF